MQDLISESQEKAMEEVRERITKEIGIEMLNRGFREVHFEYDGSNDTLAGFVLRATNNDALRFELTMGDPIALNLDDLIENMYGSYTDEAGASGDLKLRVGMDEIECTVTVAWTHQQRHKRIDYDEHVTLDENFVKDISDVIDGVASQCAIGYTGSEGWIDDMDFEFRNSDGNLVFPEKDTITDILQDQVVAMIQKSALKDFASGDGGYGTISIDTADKDKCYWNTWKYVTKTRSSESFFETDFDYPEPATSAVHTSRVKHS